MKRERIKSIALTSLVILSLVLSYRLWSYKPTYDPIQRDYIQNVKIGAQKDFENIVIPSQVVVHESNKHFVTSKQSNILPLYKALQKVEISNFENLTSDTSEQNFQGITKGKNKIEIIFPTLIPIETLDKIFKLDSKRLQNIVFDRIVIRMSQKQETSSKIYFVNDSLNLLYDATFDNSGIISAVGKIKSNYKHYTDSVKYKLQTGKTIYLPKQTVKLKTMEFLTSDIEVDKFKDAIFIDPTNVRKESSDSGDTYTDGTRLMTVSPLNRSITFVNPTIAADENQSPNVLIQKSVEFINGHGGWTDGYVLSGIKPENNEIFYRLNINNLPVFKNATIATKLGKQDDIQTYKRPLYKLNLQMEKKESEMELMSGPQIMEVLDNNKSINKSLIKDITLGYETIFDGDEDQINKFYYNRAIQLKPVWVIYYGDSFKKIDQDLLSRTGVNIVGLE
ncbi:YycH family regulatory protein [Bacillus sp. EAC]|uniref:YycH family regulatory protein n=1 Tax=Bacillus sp. EAC TaxID=1978338 RepID=UPI000B43A066|nr:two-component system activity regulator YycH [Bacillus sp. EAC]